MEIKTQLEKDLKQAMLAGDKRLVSILRGIKNVILNAEVDRGKRDSGLSDAEIIELLKKEAKQRDEAADLYKQANDLARAEAEIVEKQVIQKFLPEQMSEDELKKIVDKVMDGMGEVSAADMGKIIGEVKKATNGSADGAEIARIVKERVA